MDLRISLRQPDGVHDLQIALEPGATACQLADRLAPAPGATMNGTCCPVRTLAVEGVDGWTTVPPATPIAESAIRSGITIAVIEIGAGSPGGPGAGLASGGAVLAVVSVLAGPDRGSEFPVRAGTWTIGRGQAADIALTDPLVSRRHALIRVGQHVQVTDLGSANGLQIGDTGQTVGAVRPAIGTAVRLGNSDIAVRLLHSGSRREPVVVPFNRPPQVQPEYRGLHEEISEPPARPPGQIFPIFSILLPIALGLVIWQVTGSALTALFFGMTSMLLIGSVMEQSFFGRRNHRTASRAFRATLGEQLQRFTEARVEEQVARRCEHPSLPEVRAAILERSPMLWMRRPNDARFLVLRVGIGPQPTRSHLEPPRPLGDPVLLAEANQCAATVDNVLDVPVTIDLAVVGAAGICGRPEHRLGVARAIVLDLIGLHSPQDLRVAAIVPPVRIPDWAWLRWLPHCAPVNTRPGPGTAVRTMLGADPAAVHQVLSAIEEEAARRQAEDQASREPGSRRPVIVLLVEDGAPAERGRIVALAETGPVTGIHVIWSAGRADALPAVCRDLIQVTEPGTASVARAVTGTVVSPVCTERLDAGTAESLARALAPVADAGAPADHQSDLPHSAAFVDVLGRDITREPAAVVERWNEVLSGRPGSLHALVGQGASAPVQLDLREHGPHALVGGTTGSGKSEFLRSWLLGLAVNHGPDRVTFLLVDYKGGAAFNEIVRLPHTVGLVTDLTPRLVGRALTSLRAEIRYRERILAGAGVPDLIELERRGDPSAPPALVVVVDEFATLVQEVPEFVNGMIDIAQRGRSLGIHLILATQRPAGVIKANLRANTNLRVALRMADADDSTDVLGTPEAAAFDPAVPGRAMARLGPGQVVPFQALYAGGDSGTESALPQITVHSMGFGRHESWQDWRAAGAPATGGVTTRSHTTDLARVVDSISAAALVTGVAAPRRPWLPELPASVDLARLPTLPEHREGLAFGLLDDPERQQQYPVAYRPDVDGTMLVFGTGGSGKSALLRTLAVAAGEQAETPWQVYAVDVGSHALTALEELPHVGGVVRGDDHERVARLLDRLRDEVDERSARYARAGASTISEYRRLAQRPHEPRILLLLDNIAAFRAEYETGPHHRLYDLLPGLALDGRAAGVHLVLTADRPAIVPPALSAAAGVRLVLKLVEDMDLAMAGAPAGAFGPQTPPGRGFFGGNEIQVAVPGGVPDVARQADHLTDLAARMRARGTAAAAPIGRLSDQIDLSSLAAEVDGRPVLGVAQDSLHAVGFTPSGTFLIAGPPQSGRTTALLTAALSLHRAAPESKLAYVGHPGSPLTGHCGPAWDAIVVSPDEVAALAEDWGRLAAARGDVRLVLVIENVPGFSDTVAQQPLEQLIAALAAGGHTVVGDGESSALTSSWGLPLAMKAARHGLLLQPEQQDGESVLRTSLPRVRRSDFPPGRGIYVRSGEHRIVQVALPA